MEFHNLNRKNEKVVISRKLLNRYIVLKLSKVLFNLFILNRHALLTSNAYRNVTMNDARKQWRQVGERGHVPPGATEGARKRVR